MTKGETRRGGARARDARQPGRAYRMPCGKSTAPDAVPPNRMPCYRPRSDPTRGQLIVPPTSRHLAPLVAALVLAAATGCSDEVAPDAGDSAPVDAGPSFDTIGGGSDDPDLPDAVGDAGTDTAQDAPGEDTIPADTSAPDVADDVAPGPDTDPADATADTPAPVPPDVLVMTFNTARFFDDVCDSGRCDDGDFERAFSSGQLRYKAQLIADGVAQAAPDVLCLQEVENQRALDALVEQLGSEAWPTARIGETFFDASLDVALLSRFATLEVRTHRDMELRRPDGSRTSFAREFLEVHLDADGARFITFCAHFKSRNDDDPGRRLAEAQAAHDIVLERAAEFPDAVIVLAGDLNDEPGTAPIDAIETGGQLVRVAAELGNGDDTHSFDGRQPIDHIFWASNAGGAFRLGSAQVFRDATGGFAESDHAALRAGFDLP